GKQSAEEPDRDLEVLYLDVFIEGKILEDVLLRRGCFLVESHEDHGVERIDGSHEERLRVPVVIGFREWFQVVVAPGILFVAAPGVKKLGFDFGCQFLIGLLGLDSLDSKGHEQQQGQRSQSFHCVPFVLLWRRSESWDYRLIELFNSFDTRNLQTAWRRAQGSVLRTLFFSFFHVQIYRFVLLLASRRAWSPTSSLDNQTTVRG